ncbi:uncharacterized protein TNCV_2953251 [Trichonephila clavipes]|nr:uncharacterized protein TNCV_2953251 [Trichonephila clavipes]
MAVGSLVVRASDSRPEGLGSMLNVTKYPPSAHGFTCRNCGGGDRGRVAIYRPFGEVSLSLNRTVTCMVLKANDRRTSCPCHDEFRGPRSDYVRQLVKFLPLSENSFAHLSLRAINLFNAAMNACDVKSDTNSICTALNTKHTKIQIYTLNKFPLRCPLFLMKKGPEKSSPEQLNG